MMKSRFARVLSPWSRSGLRAAIAGVLAVVAAGACGPGEPATGQAVQAFGNSSFAMAPVVAPNTSKMSDPNGFAVYWRFDHLDPSMLTDVPTFTVTGEAGANPVVAICGSALGSQSGCAPVGDLATRGYCRCDVKGANGGTVSPGKSYTYSISVPSKGSSFINTVRTRQADPGAGFTFAVYADTHGRNRPFEERTSGGILSDPDVPAFAVMAGDLGEVGGEWWGTYGWSRLAMQYDAATGMRARLPVFMAVGNHDWWGDGSLVESGAGWPVMLNMQAGDTATLYTLAGREGYGGITGAAPGHSYRYYSFDWGNSHFIVLDSGLHAHMEIGGNGMDTYMGSFDVDTKQFQWLMDDLGSLQNRPEIKHRFVFMHAPPYSPKGNMIGLVRRKDWLNQFEYARAPDGGFNTHLLEPPVWPSDTGRLVLDDILRQHGVEAVFAGHDHFYAHLAYGGTQYFICSGGGDPEFDDKATQNRSQATFIEGDGWHGGYCTVSVTGEAYTVKRKRTTKADGSAVSPPDVLFTPWTNGGWLAPTNPAVTIASNNPGIDKSARLTWLDHSTFETGFEVQRSIGTGELDDPAWVAWTTLPANTTQYVDDNVNTGLLPATRYWYRVRAVYGGTGGSSHYSEWTRPVSLLFPECKQSTPQGDFDGTQVILAWSPFTCSGAQPLSRYRIERRADGGSPWHLLKKTNGIETLVADTALSCQPSYDYRIIAELVNGHTSQESDPVTVPVQVAGCGVSVTSSLPVTPTAIGIHWLNDGMADKWVTLQRSQDGVSWSDVVQYAPGADQPNAYTDRVTSSCSSSATYLHRVGASATATGPRTYGPVTQPIAPSMCLYPPTVTALGGAGKIILGILPNKTIPTLPDTWAIQRRVQGSPIWGERIAIPASSSTTTYDDDRDCEIEPEVTYEYRVMGLYSGANSAFDTGFGVATDWSDTISAAMTRAETGCADNGLADELVNPALHVNAWGCKGAVKWVDRDTLCAPGYSACTADQWTHLRGTQVPSAHYWTDDNLQYTGTGTNACGAVYSGGTVCTSIEPRPMRVCAPTTTDSNGNTCTWTGCGLGANTPGSPNVYLGGCSANPTAGTLCCRTSSPCADGSVVDTVAPGIGGCPGSVTWDQRDTLCAQGCRACSVKEWTDFNKAATHNYWTDGDLLYSGTGSNACAVSTTSGNACPAGQPMRICSGRQPDPEGNNCTWNGCGYGTNSPGRYFGGCSGTGSNATAGTMCCCGY